MASYQRNEAAALLVRTRHFRISNMAQHVTPTTEVFVTIEFQTAYSEVAVSVWLEKV